MRLVKVLVAFTLGALTLCAAQPDALVAHEWGTFTSVADEAGNPVEWAPWLGPSDLPCFVERMDGKNWKVILSGLVRMSHSTGGAGLFWSTRRK